MSGDFGQRYRKQYLVDRARPVEKQLVIRLEVCGHVTAKKDIVSKNGFMTKDCQRFSGNYPFSVATCKTHDTSHLKC